VEKLQAETASSDMELLITIVCHFNIFVLLNFGARLPNPTSFRLYALISVWPVDSIYKVNAKKRKLYQSSIALYKKACNAKLSFKNDQTEITVFVFNINLPGTLTSDI